MKMHHGVRALDVAGELAQRLRHQPRVQADLHLAHLAFDLGLGRERGHRVDHHDVDRAGAHQHVGDLQRLLAGVRLRDQQVVDVDAELLGVARIERVLGVDERGGAAAALHLGDHLQRQRGLAGGLRAVDLHHAAARQAADAERDVQPQRAGGDRLDVVGSRRHRRDASPSLCRIASRSGPARRRAPSCGFLPSRAVPGKVVGGEEISRARLSHKVEPPVARHTVQFLVYLRDFCAPTSG